MGSTNIPTAKKTCRIRKKSESYQESCPLKMKDIISFISLYLFIGIKAYQVRDFDITNNGLQCKTPCGKNGLHEGRYWCHTEKSWDFCDFKHKEVSSFQNGLYTKKMGKKLVKFVGYVKDKISRQSNSVKEILFPSTNRQDNPGLTTAVNGIATGVAIAVATSVVAMVVEYLNPRQNAVVGSSIPPPLSTVVQAIAQVAPAPPPPAGGGNACVANCPVAPAPVPPGRRRRRQTQNYNVKELNYRLRSLIRSRLPKPSYL